LAVVVGYAWNSAFAWGAVEDRPSRPVVRSFKITDNEGGGALRMTTLWHYESKRLTVKKLTTRSNVVQGESSVLKVSPYYGRNSDRPLIWKRVSIGSPAIAYRFHSRDQIDVWVRGSLGTSGEWKPVESSRLPEVLGQLTDWAKQLSAASAREQAVDKLLSAE
jgi:hypothetical protein